jgi:hypothetical protein
MTRENRLYIGRFCLLVYKEASPACELNKSYIVYWHIILALLNIRATGLAYGLKSFAIIRLRFTLYRIAFRVAARKSTSSDTECTTFRSWVKQRLSVAIIPLKIAFLKSTDRWFSRRYDRCLVQCKRTIKLNIYACARGVSTKVILLFAYTKLQRTQLICTCSPKLQKNFYIKFTLFYIDHFTWLWNFKYVELEHFTCENAHYTSDVKFRNIFFEMIHICEKYILKLFRTGIYYFVVATWYLQRTI